jgi:hypothetical protein
MALGVLSCASKVRFVLLSALSPVQQSSVQMILAQADRDYAVHRLLAKLAQIYDFMTQDETLSRISSMRDIIGRISQQTLECARFMRDYSETKNFCESYHALHNVHSQSSIVILGKRLGKNIVQETDIIIQRYSDVLDGLMQQLRDQVTRDVPKFARASESTTSYLSSDEILDLNDMPYAAGTGLDTSKLCLPGTRTENFLSDHRMDKCQWR